MLGGDHIINHNDRFNPIAGRSLEGPNEVGWPMHWEEQDLKAKLWLAAFIAPTAISVPGFGSYQRTATRKRSGKPL